MRRGAGFRPLVSKPVSSDLVSWGEGEPESVVVVPVAGRVVVPVRRPAIPGGVVPAPAPIDTVRAFLDETHNHSYELFDCLFIFLSIFILCFLRCQFVHFFRNTIRIFR